MEQLFSLSINRLNVRGGELLWNDQRIPFDLNVADLSAQMVYSFLRGRYESNVSLGKVDTKFRDFRPFSWTAAAHFSLGKNDVEVTSLLWNSGHSHVEANGKLSDFRQPKIEATYSGSIDLLEAAAIARQVEVRSGSLEVAGKGSWSAASFASDGKASLKNFDWHDNQLTLHDANLGSDFSINDRATQICEGARASAWWFLYGRCRDQ